MNEEKTQHAISEEQRVRWRAANKRWRKRHPGKVKAANHRNYYADPQKAREAQRKFRSSKPRRAAVIMVKSRAKRKGLKCDVEYLMSEARLPCPIACFYLGTPISFERGEGQRLPENIASFDQIIPGGGYIEGNVRIISYLANSMLYASTKEQRLSFALAILKEQGEILRRS